MEDMRKVEEGTAFPKKCKMDLPNPMNETFEQKEEGRIFESESNKRQKLETGLKNETNIGFFFLINGKMAETEDGEEDSKTNEDDNLKGKPEIIPRARRFTAAEKGKGILIEEFDEEECDYDDNDSSDDSDSDFSDGLDSGSEDIPF